MEFTHASTHACRAVTVPGIHGKFSPNPLISLAVRAFAVFNQHIVVYHYTAHDLRLDDLPLDPGDRDVHAQLHALHGLAVERLSPISFVSVASPSMAFLTVFLASKLSARIF